VPVLIELDTRDIDTKEHTMTQTHLVRDWNDTHTLCALDTEGLNLVSVAGSQGLAFGAMCPPCLMVEAGIADGPQNAIAHSNRFRRVSNRYPHMVALAYDLDIVAAARDTDEQVAERVAAYERAQGWTPRNWKAIGRSEGRSA
jgi:hypothetical protein